MSSCSRSPTGVHEYAVGRLTCVFCDRVSDDAEVGRRFLDDASPSWMKRRGKR